MHLSHNILPNPTVLSTTASISLDNEPTLQTNHQCHICYKLFPKKSKLNRHINECHNNIYNYKCQLCDNQYKRLSHLKRHLITHSNNPKPFVCEYPNCLMNFTNKSHLNRHVHIKHHNHFYTCKHCNQQFRKKKYLNLHSLSCLHPHHNTQPKNSLQQTNQQKMKKHNENQEYVFICFHQDCGRVYSKKSNLKYHLVNKHGYKQKDEEVTDTVIQGTQVNEIFIDE